MAESVKQLKSLLMKVKVSQKAGLKIEIKKIKMMISGPTTSQQINGETMERLADFFFWDSKIIADGDSSHETKRTCSLEENLWPT